MRLKATVYNPVGLHRIVQTLDKFGPICVMSFSTDSIRFISHDERAGSIRAWVKAQPSAFLSNYRIQSRLEGCEIPLTLRLEFLLPITKIAQNATDVKISLKRSENQVYMSWDMATENREGRLCRLVQNISVVAVSQATMPAIRDPIAVNSPHVFIFLPSMNSLKPVADRLRQIGKYMYISANMAGELKLIVANDVAECETTYSRLENPRIPDYELEDVRKFATVRITTEDFVNFMNSYQLVPDNVICSITDNEQLAFYLYINNDIHHQADPSVVRSSAIDQTVMTCFVPVCQEY
ncbi:checkpoint protein Hus1/Mec3 [Phycomyces blakesleeanus]|uniref:Checkpoint protein n=1 Tax=Phycomyces blakesleeanus TaxID=4837 RepID=A0ABR3B1P9_PHYBL